MNKIDLTVLEALARNATQGKWYAPEAGDKMPKSCGMSRDYPIFDPAHFSDYAVWTTSRHHEEEPSVASSLFPDDAKFIAAANPQVILEIISSLKDAVVMIRGRDIEIKALKAQLKLARKGL